MSQGEPPQSEPGRAIRKRSVLSVLLLQLAAPVLGAGLGYLLLVQALLPRVGLGEVDRIRRLGAHLRELTPATGTAPGIVRNGWVALLGDSVCREGLDGGLVERAFGESPPHVENLAVSGCSLTEMAIQLPLVLQARPRVVVLCLQPAALLRVPRLPPDKAFAYAYGGFVDAWKDEPTLARQFATPDAPGLDAELRDALEASRWRQQLHFRTAPLTWLNRRLRGAVTGDARGDRDNDWSTPFLMTRSVRDQRLDWHLDEVRGWWRQSGDAAENADEPCPEELLLAAMADAVARHDALPVIVLAPVHPQLADDARPLLDRALRMARRAVGASEQVLIACARLNESEFADALHPNAAGRATYSQVVGEQLASLGASSTSIARQPAATPSRSTR